MAEQYRVELRNYEGFVSAQTFGSEDSALTFALTFATEGITAKLFRQPAPEQDEPENFWDALYR